jgi:chromosome segregation ATPase
LSIEQWLFGHLDGNVIVMGAVVLILAWRTRNAAFSVQSAALSAALASLQTMSKRVDEIEVIRDRDRREHETERQDWEVRINAVGAELLRTKRDLGQTIERQAGELIQLRGKLAAEEQGRKRLQDCVEQLESQNTTLQKRVMALESENVRLTKERDGLKAEVTALHQKVDALKRQALSNEKAEAGETASNPGEGEEKETK